MDIKVGTSFRHLWARILFGSEHFIGHMVDRYFHLIFVNARSRTEFSSDNFLFSSLTKANSFSNAAIFSCLFESCLFSAAQFEPHPLKQSLFSLSCARRPGLQGCNLCSAVLTSPFSEVSFSLVFFTVSSSTLRMTAPSSDPPSSSSSPEVSPLSLLSSLPRYTTPVDRRFSRIFRRSLCIFPLLHLFILKLVFSLLLVSGCNFMDKKLSSRS